MEAITCHVVVPAAGAGERFLSDVPKQFFLVNDEAVISHTVGKFNCESFVKTIVVVAPSQIELAEKMSDVLGSHMHSKKVHVTTGKNTRHRSIFEGLKYLKEILNEKSCNAGNNDIVIIHDGVRPFISTHDMKEVVFAAAKCKASGIVKPLVSTVIAVSDDDMLTQSLNRSEFWASEMPQAFRLGTILDAYKKCSEFELDHGTECLQLVLKYEGVAAKLIHGDPGNLWKITHQTDIPAAAEILNRNRNGILLHLDHLTGSLNIKKHLLEERNLNVTVISSPADLSNYITLNIKGFLCCLDETLTLNDTVKIILQTATDIEDKTVGEQTIAIVFLQSGSQFILSRNESEERVLFSNLAAKCSQHNFLVHAIRSRSLTDISQSSSMKAAVTLLNNHAKILNGQILYYDS